MTKSEVKIRIEKLKKEVNYHRYLYHVLDKPEISDSALDSLKNELFKLEQQYPEFITKDSPTQRVGGQALKEFKKIKHDVRMLSFNDAFSKEDIFDWQKRMENYLKEKIKSNLSVNGHHAIRSEKVVEECQVCWDAYQHIRRELSWDYVGKDWRKDQRNWTGEDAMWGSSFDDPFKVSRLEGDFKTTIHKD